VTSFEVYAPLVKLALALAAVVVLSIGGGTVAATTTPSSSPSNDPALEPLLLTIDDFPTGWAVAPPDYLDDDEPTTSEPGEDCGSATYDQLLQFDEEIPQAEAAFVGGGSMFDIVGQYVGLFDSDDEAEALVGLIDDQLEACPTSTDEEGATTTFSPMSFPDLGDASAAYRGTIENSFFPFSVALVIVAVDDKVIMLFGVGSGGDGELMEDLARTSVDRAD